MQDQSGAEFDRSRDSSQVALARRISLPLLILYGLGVTVGAGIYVLIGAAAARAGVHAPLAFIAAALLVGFSAASYAELTTRFPVSAGEAKYVREGLGLNSLSIAVGLMICVAGSFSSATLVRGGAGYLNEFFALPSWVLMTSLVITLGLLAAWGIAQTVLAAALFTCLEVGGLLIIISAGLVEPGRVLESAQAAFSIPDAAALAGISGATLLAFFAFIGFEDMVNVVEEVEKPRRALPIAIGLTLVLTTILYVLVALVALAYVPISELSASTAPLALVFERTLGASGDFVAAIAVAAVVNGALIQMVMITRILYGMSRMGQLPKALGEVNPRTRTPLTATSFVTLVILILCLSLGVTELADVVSSVTLVVFALVNLSLWRLHALGPQPPDTFAVPRWVPPLGFVTSMMFVIFEFGRRFTEFL